ncbi:hypothetical protein [Legionella spiritensis]|uniref:Uncharacterized protein n=1 Tax=Legionella spiritensis TaxID=452 RepID=A0A0W0ZAD6_LEGSP|nr:hypothetical protein [Legionella spiritensis]KTD66096.1 hypothetical protein Lspi_0159 [Legionella spiritensis]SNV44209.1 Uncharacterised protein [Legionella spiritensis]
MFKRMSGKIIFFLLVQSCFHPIVLAQKAQINRLLPQTLTLSHLPPAMMEKMRIDETTSYAQGHLFYDSALSLKDTSGRIISNLKDFQRTATYQLEHIKSPDFLINNIWFFSPDGSDEIVTRDNIREKCTFEAPCQKLSQEIIDALPEDEKIYLWLASGDYDLPSHQQQKGQFLSLKHRMAIVGRTADFKHIAYGEERPVLKGSLLWNDYAGHEGAAGTIENVIVKTNANPVQVDNYDFDINIYSNGFLTLSNVLLIKKTDGRGLNIFADAIDARDLTCHLNSDDTSMNIFTDGMLILEKTNLTIVGKNSGNIYAMNSYVDITDSNFNVVEEDCDATSVTIDSRNYFALKHGIDARMSHSSIFVTSKNPDCAYQKRTSLRGIHLLTDDAAKHPAVLYHNQITVKGMSAKSTAIESYRSPMDFFNMSVLAESKLNDAVAVAGKAELYFTDEDSHIQVVSSTNTQLFEDKITVHNDPEMPSKCQINNGPEMPCS